ncbi:MAG: DUF2493 domain-containing protein [Clostridia bacterium]|nr:DUF2493 domain-containing protein [Clostridia bacterium]
MKKRIIISGSREFNDYDLFSHVVDRCLLRIKQQYELVILSGHCRGTDLMAERYAKENGIELEIYPADWSLGKKAGPLRNKKMIELADYAIAFPGKGNGTKSLIYYAQEKGIPLKIYPVY